MYGSSKHYHLWCRFCVTTSCSFKNLCSHILRQWSVVNTRFQSWCGTHVYYTSSLSTLTHRNTCWVPHTCLCSCTSAHKHLHNICYHKDNQILFFFSNSTVSGLKCAILLTLLTPLSHVAFRAGAHVVPHTLTPVLTRRTAHSWRRHNMNRVTQNINRS